MSCVFIGAGFIGHSFIVAGFIGDGFVASGFIGVGFHGNSSASQLLSQSSVSNYCAENCSASQ